MDNPFSFENIVWSARKCLNGVRWKNSVALWQKNFLANCERLYNDIKAGKYHMSPVTRFEISVPKKRVVSSMKFRDRVVHKIICHQGGLVKDLFNDAFYDNCACRTGKGTHFARMRMEHHFHDYFRKHGLAGYVLNLDIRKFFDSIPHDRLMEMVRKKVKNKFVVEFVEEVIERGGENKIGIDLGSEISQCLANSYLTPIDHFIKHKLRIKSYVRYADNMVLIVPHTRAEAISTMHMIERELEKLGLNLNGKSQVIPIGCKVRFLGFNYWLNGNGRLFVKILSKKARDAMRHLKNMMNRMDDEKRCRSMLDCWKSHYGYSNVKDRRVEKFYEYARKSI